MTAKPLHGAVVFSERRHDFLMHYYDMAVKDLERHLKIGWQTIAIVAGAVASIGLAQQNLLPVPIAITAAFIIAFWGALNVIDANRWAVRAIAFLANVEAFYFSVEDRRYLNPYAGSHPPYTLMDSLRYQGLVVFLFVILFLVYYIAKINEKSEQAGSLIILLVTTDFWNIIFWQIPIYAFLGFIVYLIRTWARHVRGYYEFIRDSPGPGMAKTHGDLEKLYADAPSAERPLDTVSTQIVQSGEDIQEKHRKEAQSASARWMCLATVSLWIGAVLAVGLVALALFRECLGPI